MRKERKHAVDQEKKIQERKRKKARSRQIAKKKIKILLFFFYKFPPQKTAHEV